MKNQTLNFLFAVFMGLFSSFSMASSTGQELNRLLLVSGITKNVVELPWLMKIQFTPIIQQAASIPDNEIPLIVNGIDKRVSPFLILCKIRSSLEKSLSDQDIEMLLEWYESDIGRNITAAEEKVLSMEALQQVANTTQQLLTNTKRVEMAVRINNHFGTIDSSMEIEKYTSILVYSGIKSLVTPDQPRNLGVFLSQRRKLAPQVRAKKQQFSSALFVYTYQQINDDSLAKYENFLNHPVAMKFYHSTHKEINKSLKNSINLLVIDLANILKNKNYKNGEFETEV